MSSGNYGGRRACPVGVLILDFDGVVLESVGVKTEGFRSLFSFTPEHVEEIVDYHRRNTGVSRFDKFRHIYREILKEPLSDDQFRFLSDRYAELVVEGVVSSPFVPGAREFLAAWHGRIPLFVVSASPQEELEAIVHRRGLTPCFRKVYGAPAKKEDAIREILAMTRTPKGQALFVGDAVNDLRAAVAAGVRFAGREPPEEPGRFRGLREAEAVVPDLAGLGRYLEGLGC